ncbi:MAG: AAA family ATPase, partial [Candidatus Diapherotrites archaeon CG_4_10_14_0_2_um_filter_31_5]
INLEDEKIDAKLLEKMEVNKQDFEDALKEAQPSALREVLVEVPNVKWEDIGSLEEIKEELKQVVDCPLKHKEAFDKMGITAPRGVFLYGAPGTGKTLLAKAVATESGKNFISIKGPELISKWVGETERGIRKIFKKARQVSPVIIFFDEIDSLASSSRDGFESGTQSVTRSALNQLLTELDGIEELKDVIFIAATNRPDLIDSSLLRPGRIDKMILVPAPDEKARKEIFKIHLKKIPKEKEVNIEELAKKTEGFSGADIEGLVRETVLIALKESNMEKNNIRMKHFEQALKKTKPSISKETIEAYEEFSEHYSVFKPSYVE